MATRRTTLADIGNAPNRGPMKPNPAEEVGIGLPRPQNPGPVGGPVQVPPPADVTTQQRPTGPRTGPYGITWGDAVTDPAEQQRILGLAEDFVRRNEAGSGLGANMYQPGHSREEALQQAAYSFFPTRSGGAVGAGGSTVGTGTGGGAGGNYGAFVPPPVTLSEVGRHRISEAQKARQRSAAARGTLLNTGTVKALERDAQDIASEEYQNDFNRALAGYNTNRDTYAMNNRETMATAPPPNVPFATSGPSDYGDVNIYGRPQSAQVTSPVTASDTGMTYADMVARQREQNDLESMLMRGPQSTLLTRNLLSAPVNRPRMR